MTPKLSDEIRQEYLDYFQRHGHHIVKSTPLILPNDPTLLFTNAGMNQFKPYFLGIEKPKFSRVADSQRCMRVSGKHNDLEEVGFSPHHHTMFEMLGNWSFGDYYKQEAIRWAWDLLTGVWSLPKDKLWVSVFDDPEKEIPTDIEAAETWKNSTDIDPSHILYFGRKDNFWEMGETGPCGPCTEIHIDRGESFCNLAGLDHRCSVNGDCRRFIELWNLVFIQYQRKSASVLEMLPSRHVDTGMGLERITSILQNAPSNYDTDLFMPIMDSLQEIAGHDDNERKSSGVSYKVVADHSRAAAFLIADGILPSNEWRGYVLRRIIRRAVRFGKKIGIDEPFLWRIAETVVDKMSPVYPELRAAGPHLQSIIRSEEERFFKTLDQGLPMVEELVGKTRESGAKLIPGDQIFRLYDTYGFPPDIIADIAREENMTIDQSGFESAMSEQKARARSAWKGSETKDLGPYETLLRRLPPVEFTGYTELTGQASIQAIIRDSREVDVAESNVTCEFVLDRSPFYAESGGQTGDTGYIDGGNSRFLVTDTQKITPALSVVKGRVTRGSFQKGDRVTLSVDRDRRLSTARNHTSTHLLHAALRHVLGDHVKQSGSLVTKDRFRFDFTHHKALDHDEIHAIEAFVFQAIIGNHPVMKSHSSLDEALSRGVIALFDEKYQDIVRIVEIEGISAELCGGTHVERTGDIGFFKIVTESSISAGIRRIEGLTGLEAFRLVSEYEGILKKTASALKTNPESIPERVEKLQKQLRQFSRQLEEATSKNLKDTILTDSREPVMVNDIPVIIQNVPDLPMNQLRDLADVLKNKIKSGIIILGSANGGKVSIVVSVTKDLAGRYPANRIIVSIAERVGGGGGGRPEMAQAGGSQPQNLNSALSEAVRAVENC